MASSDNGLIEMRVAPVRRWDDWTRWLIGGLVAGLVAWGGVGSRLAALETEVRLSSERSVYERGINRQAIAELVTQFSGLQDEVRTLRQQVQMMQQEMQRDQSR